MRSPGPVRTDFFGREEELASVRAALDAGGCVVAGPAGIGKSRLAAEAVGQGPVIRVLATKSAAALPYGAFAHLLQPGSQRTADVIPAFIQMLRADHADAVPVVLVDDAHLLDDPSAALVLALSATGAARLLVTVRAPDPTPDAITALWKEQGLDRLDLQSLGRNDVRDLVHAHLGGPVHPRVVSRITELSQGNPLHVRELLHDTRQTGALERGSEGWRWKEELLAFDRLSVLIQRRTRTISDAGRDALELVAVAEHLPLDVLTELTSLEAVEELEREDLVRVGPGASAHVTIAHPLYGEVVAAGLPRTTGLRIRRRAADALKGIGADPLQVATLLLEAGAPDPPLFIEASRIAMARGGVRFALRLAQAAGESIEAALAVARALTALKRVDDVEPLLAPFEAIASRSAFWVSLEYVGLRCRGLLGGSQPDEIRVDLLEQAKDWHTGPDWDALIATQNAWTAFFAGRPKDVLRCVEQFADDERVSVPRRIALWVLAANAHERLARFDDCAVCTERGRRLVSDMGQMPSEFHVGLMMAELLPRVRAGRDLAGVEAVLLATRAEAADSGDRTLLAAVPMMLGILSLRRGHPADAVAYFEENAEAVTEADVIDTGLYAATCRAEAFASCGDGERAQAQLDEMDRLAREQPRNAWRYAVNIETARALVDGGAGRTSAAAALLLAVADAGHGDPAGEIVALYEALRFGADPAGVARRLRPLLAGTQDELGQLFAEHADALADHDAAAQLSLAVRFHQRGCDLIAAEAAARAARAFADAGYRASSREATSLATKFVAPCGPVFSWALQMRPDVPALTPREREIALLAARGLQNRQIAEQLVMSIRTVESHLLRACRKLGVANRRALCEVIGR